MQKFQVLSFILLGLLFSCTQKTELKTGKWRGVIDCQGHDLPFTFDVARHNDSLLVYIHNGTEKILLDEVSVFGDSVSMVLHVFDAELRAKIEGDKLTGTFVKNYAPQANQPFTATFGDDYRFAKNSSNPSTNFAGKYQIEFKNARGRVMPSVGMFEQQGNHLTGSFLTPTGDYRFLEGNVVDGKLMLSTFDGNHAYIFIASQSGDSLTGDFFAGKLTHETFKGVKNENATMPDAESLTYLKEGYDKIDFRFPDLNKKMISPSDEKFKNKVLILQIFGTWCPNCLDETRFLVPWYNANHERGVEILGLAYERKDDFNYASQHVKKVKEKLKVPYDFVIAGVDNAEKASQTLPMLNRLMGWPTTIIIGKDGKVKYIHTGFEGPGTGIYYEQFKERFNQIVNTCLAGTL
ncbi:MAG: TlpA family protein disulfide reductase [Bacteroidetes bacterium]|nr:TlpA family protein disulfide reductase [Bacteroidota bacterium]